MEKCLKQMFLISPLSFLWRNVLDNKKKELSSGFSMWMTDDKDKRTLDFVFRQESWFENRQYYVRSREQY